MLYEIVIRGYIKDTWFEELSVMEQSNLTTIIRGELLDQSALYGILRRINDLGIDLISVNVIKE
ncbi:MAG: hypothetical protein GX787_01990 [Tissierellia bacterium]|jgi:hypothetical protein|nr:hypothetical protein [Tissierellia bacterium]